MPRIVLALAALLLVAAPASAQSDEVTGDWSGVLDLTSVMPDGPSLTVIFHITAEDGGYAATFDSPDQGAYGLPADSIGFDPATRVLHIRGQNSTYTGTMNAEGTEVAGTWSQGGRELPLVLTPYEVPVERAAAAPKDRPKAEPGDLTGTWEGALAIPGGGEMRLSFELTRGEDGTHTAVLDAPGQAENLDIGAIQVQGREVTMNIMGQASFTGTLDADETVMEGTFAQGEQKLPMTLTRQ
jgi:hypothetical protein